MLGGHGLRIGRQHSFAHRAVVLLEVVDGLLPVFLVREGNDLRQKSLIHIIQGIISRRGLRLIFFPVIVVLIVSPPKPSMLGALGGGGAPL